MPENQDNNWDHCLRHASISDVGVRRANNQDNLAVVLADGQTTWQKRGHLFLVADGMGAHAAGELASKMAADLIPLTYHKQQQLSPPEAILNATVEANARIHARGQASSDFHGMGTTGTALVLLPRGAILAHVGDSRAYRLRGNRLEQLTFDHSLVWELRKAGNLSDEEVPGYVGKNVITRSLGPNETVDVDLEGPHPILVGDTFLLCSDGLTGQVEDEELGTILMCLPPEEAVHSLVDLANLRGGPDNITIIVARVTGPHIAHGTSNGEPPPEGPNVQPVNPLIWALLGVAALGSGVLAVLGSLWGALFGLIAAVIIGAIAATLRYGGPPKPRFEHAKRGQGPYSATTCGATRDFANSLHELVRQLRDGATREQWDVDLEQFDRLAARGDQAAGEGDFAAAVADRLRAIRFVMDDLKQRRRAGTASKRGPDSALD